ncbi:MULTISPECIES: Abi family protein [Deinococcus]|uniref:Abi family protein n=1 Tax=Deinococcus rufus TaxID=2136097 RepID=A0ABV7Z640_9DEIO|nr:Abi family protein [Deinococcus sp. AB2017081]WQE97208.1 Abi family protein [Deinococcus sp. AB2017081]
MTLTQQRLHLQHKGVVIRDVRAAEAILATVSLYRLKGYAHYLKDPLTRRYVGADFDRIVGLMRLDAELRSHLFRGLQSIEVGARTHISEFLTTTYGGDWYTQRAVFPGRATDARFLTSKLQEEFDRSQEDFAVHFRHRYPGYPLPAWVATELYTFAIWSRLFEALSEADKGAIATPLGLTWQRLQDALKALTVLRNRVAHHARVWNFSFVPMALPGTGGSALRRQMLATSLIPAGAERTLAARLYAMHVLLRAFGERHWSRDLRLVNRFEPYGLRRLGLREGWEEQPQWST